MSAVDTGSSVKDDAGPAIDGEGAVDPVVARLQALHSMEYTTLRTEWRRLYRAMPPRRLSADLLRLGVAWKIQEQAYGGLTAATKRRLATLTKTLERAGDVTRNRVARLKPGVTLVRDWGGETHRVRVLEEGFAWRGQEWRSLSAIARAITGSHWSGPRFFGLIDSRRDPRGRGDA
ncbi:MAG: DUF2924 domain-containing protein [Rhodospirillales bacterium]|nr:DUF2924 domain-containing protein [Rhodospirillales bacterium]